MAYESEGGVEAVRKASPAEPVVGFLFYRVRAGHPCRGDKVRPGGDAAG